MTDQQNPDVEARDACEAWAVDEAISRCQTLRRDDFTAGYLAALRPSSLDTGVLERLTAWPDIADEHGAAWASSRGDYSVSKPHDPAADLRALIADYKRLLALPPASSGGAWRPTHRHVKRGTEYRLIGRGIVQTSEPLNDDEYVMIYEGQDGSLWARDADEWSDGRFEALSAPPADPVRA